MPLPPIYLNTVTIKGASLADKMSLARRYGFQGLEVWAHEVAPQVLSQADLREGRERYLLKASAKHADPTAIKLMAEENGLSIDGIIPGSDLAVRWSDQLDAPMLAAFDATIQVCATLGGRYVVMPALGDRGTLNDVAINLRRVGQIAGDYGIRLGLEPMGHCRKVNGIKSALEVLDMAALGEQAGLVLDAFHFFRAGQGIAALSLVRGEQIVTVHINDALPMPIDRLYGHQHREYPGRGIFDVVGFCSAVMERGYQGPFTVEILNESYWSDPPEQVCEAAFASSVDVLSEALKRRGTGRSLEGRSA